MLCPYCGRDVEDATVCPYCNEPLQTAPAQTENDQPEAKEPAKNIFAILSLILAILGQSLPAWVLGTVGLAFAETKYEGRGKAIEKQ